MLGLGVDRGERIDGLDILMIAKSLSLVSIVRLVCRLLILLFDDWRRLVSILLRAGLDHHGGLEKLLDA